MGVAGLDLITGTMKRKFWNGLSKRVRIPYLKLSTVLVEYLSTATHVKCRGNLGRPISKAKYFSGPIVN